MGSNTLPEHLKLALQRHIEDDDLRNDSDLPALMDKLTTLSDKVNAANEKALALRKQRS